MITIKRSTPPRPSKPTEAQQAFTRELEALNGGPDSFTKDAPPGVLHAIGRRWAEHPGADPARLLELLPALPPAVLFELTNGELGELHPADEGEAHPHARYWAMAAADRIKLGAGERLAELYLEETGLSARAVEHRFQLLLNTGGPVLDLTRLSAAERDEIEATGRHLVKLKHLAWVVLSPWPLKLDEEEKALIQSSPEEVAQLRELWEAKEPDTARGKELSWFGRPDHGIHTELPSAAETVATYRRLSAKAAMTAEEIETAADTLLIGPDGTRHPDTDKWADARGWWLGHGFMRSHLEDLDKEARRQELEEERRKREDAERERDAARAEAEAAKEETRRVQSFFGKREMPEHTRYPQMFMDNALATREDWKGQLDFLKSLERRGKLNPEHTPTPAQCALLEEEARLDTSPEHWDLPTPEWRLLHAVYTLYTSLGRDGETYAGEYIPEDWPALYAAAGLPENEGARGKRGDFSKTRRDELRKALEKLAKDPRHPGSGREVPVLIRRRSQKKGKKKGEVLWTVLAETLPVLKRLPVWDGLAEAEADQLRRDPPEHWPEPSGWVLALPKALRSGLDDYFRLMPADLPARLEAAAKQVQPKGKSAGVQPRDWTFTLWLYKQTPTERDGRRFVYVDRADLARRVPALRTYLESRQKKRLADYTQQAYETAKQAGLLVDYRLDELRSEGIRDVLELNPPMFPGGEARGTLRAGGGR